MNSRLGLNDKCVTVLKEWHSRKGTRVWKL